MLVGVSLAQPVSDMLLYTDASKQGWGAHLLERHTACPLTEVEQLHDINWLELQAVSLAL